MTTSGPTSSIPVSSAGSPAPAAITPAPAAGLPAPAAAPSAGRPAPAAAPSAGLPAPAAPAAIPFAPPLALGVGHGATPPGVSPSTPPASTFGAGTPGVLQQHAASVAQPSVVTDVPPLPSATMDTIFSDAAIYSDALAASMRYPGYTYPQMAGFPQGTYPLALGFPRAPLPSQANTSSLPYGGALPYSPTPPGFPPQQQQPLFYGAGQFTHTALPSIVTIAPAITIKLDGRIAAKFGSQQEIVDPSPKLSLREIKEEKDVKDPKKKPAALALKTSAAEASAAEASAAKGTFESSSSLSTIMLAGNNTFGYSASKSPVALAIDSKPAEG
nr:uncharacterized protein LOC127326279 [Lolium perenne]